jgi:hypothetical protein
MSHDDMTARKITFLKNNLFENIYLDSGPLCIFFYRLRYIFGFDIWLVFYEGGQFTCIGTGPYNFSGFLLHQDNFLPGMSDGDYMTGLKASGVYEYFVPIFFK